MIWPARPRHGWPGTGTWTGLAIDLGGSFNRGVRPTNGWAAYLDELLASIAARDRRRQKPHLFRLDDLCVLTVELSGARAGV